MNEVFVPDIVISRLPLYLQILNHMAKEGLHTVSSKDMSARSGYSASQIRKDLSFFGGFGKQGRGYSIYHLIEQLQSILNVNRIWQAAVLGVGDLGRALTHYQGFAHQGIEIALLFDSDPKIVGTQVGSLIVQHVDNLEVEITRLCLVMAILTLPAEAAQAIANRLVDVGIRAILNYAPVKLRLPETVQVQNIDPVLHLQHMMYYLRDC